MLKKLSLSGTSHIAVSRESDHFHSLLIRMILTGFWGFGVLGLLGRLERVLWLLGKVTRVLWLLGGGKSTVLTREGGKSAAVTGEGGKGTVITREGGKSACWVWYLRWGKCQE